jgi:hypothetical protein
LALLQERGGSRGGLGVSSSGAATPIADLRSNVRDLEAKRARVEEKLVGNRKFLDKALDEALM